MENPRILMRRWSLTRKAQVVCATFAFLLTCALAVLESMQVSIANNRLHQEASGFYSLVMTPTSVLVGIVGVSQKFGHQTYHIVAILLNAILAFCLVGLLGRLITIVKHKLQRPK